MRPLLHHRARTLLSVWQANLKCNSDHHAKHVRANYPHGGGKDATGAAEMAPCRADHATQPLLCRGGFHDSQMEPSHTGESHHASSSVGASHCASDGAARGH